ncbi:pathogenicity island protein [Staphylococcus coagulans]|uniref:pathogenicity island protein n=1 Tax=Staphylococcus coagulans TaxID=74706 RepID=UPI0015FD15BE|nr:pathogenicity island protein [Staphylococcus coagulans]MBA8764185.1 pathogenicity island protein [Staphylococcus coagulans]MBT2810393.1 pathogenicity island protein [Staphylococcus coagulans]MBT2811788.1 pathogenicity island protein [Staphylococcus coagulans]MBT2819101.1 pathogenicity island protein [Staphylococcus coagulans]MBT2821915.1 pathogenicity island protein [Staphylococcus coagulans]
MHLNQKTQLSQVVRKLEKVISDYKTVRVNYNSATGLALNETEFLEKVLKNYHRELFNILAYLKFDSEAYEIVNEVVCTLYDVMNETQDIYRYSVIDDKGEHKYTTDRKGHLIGVLEWALNYIIENIEVEEF